LSGVRHLASLLPDIKSKAGAAGDKQGDAGRGDSRDSVRKVAAALAATLFFYRRRP
jgi:hypothetical protein